MINSSWMPHKGSWASAARKRPSSQFHLGDTNYGEDRNYLEDTNFSAPDIWTIREAIRQYDEAKLEHAKLRKTKIKYYAFLVAILIVFAIGGILWLNSDARFISICRSGCLEEVKTAVGKGKWNINTQDAGVTPLMAAVSDNPDLEIAKFLIKSGADVNGEGGNGTTALTIAAEYGRVEAVKILLDAGAKVSPLTRYDENMPLAAAARNGDPEIVNILLKAGANVNQYSYKSPLSYAVEKGHSDIVNILLNAGAKLDHGGELLKIASKKGNLGIVQALIRAGANVNEHSDGETLLSIAAKNGQAEIVKVLVSAGAEDNIREMLNHAKNSETKEALREGIRSRRPVTEKEIIDVAKRYDFDIINNENITFTNQTTGEAKAIAKKETVSGTVFFCSDRVVYEKGYWFFAPDTYNAYYYSDFRNNPDVPASDYATYKEMVRYLFKDEISGTLLDNVVSIFMSLTY